MASSLREKFKLLRQWQIQQQDEFMQKKILDDRSYHDPGNSGEKPVEILDNSLKIGGVTETEHDKGVSLEGRDSVESSMETKLLQRMSSISLEKALKLAVNELNAQNEDTLHEQSNDISQVEESFDVTRESQDSADSDDDHNYFQDNLGRASLKTAIFKPETDIHHLHSEGESETGNVNEMDGFYPITYSEDNWSEDDAASDAEEDGDSGADIDVENQHMETGNIPFDEQPIPSKLGTDLISFEELIERQLQAEQERKTNKQQAKAVVKENGTTGRTFLRKGDGTARFKAGPIVLRQEKGTRASHLPKTTLKLNADQSNSNGKSAKADKKEISGAKKLDGCNNLPFERFKGTMAQPDAPHTEKISFESSQVRDPISRPRTKDGRIVDSSMEASFQKMMETKNVAEKIADEELAEFELLEQVALDTSISSNASSVLRIVSRKNVSKNVTSSPKHKELASIKSDNELEENADSLAENSVEEPSDDVESDTDTSFDNEANKTVISKEREGKTDSELEANMDAKEDLFLDNSTWENTSEKSILTDDGNSTITDSPASTVKVHQTSQLNDSPPPTSKLMRKIFPKLEKEQPSKQPSKSSRLMTQRKSLSEKQGPVLSNGKENVPPQTQSGLLKSKLAELDSEILRFKSENAEMERLRTEREKELNNLRNEVEQFQKQRADELERIEKFRDEEMQKLKKERKTFEKYQKAIRSAPSKKEREEIETLKLQVAELQDDMKRREAKWNGSAARFRNRVAELENENYELKENLKLLEQERLQRWAKADQQDLSRKNKVGSKQSEKDRVEEPDEEMQNQHSKTVSQNIPRKVKSMLKKTASPVGGNESSKANRKAEGIPRRDILPYQQPQAPRTNLLDANIAKELHEQPNVRLSLTPERQFLQGEKLEQSDSEMRHQDGKVERILTDGSREITFPNGTRKTIDSTNLNVIVSFFNGDIKQMLQDGRTIYFYAESKTTHTTYKDGTEVFEFSNGQSEKHFPDGRKVITFNDQTVKCVFVNGAEETVFADGTIQNVDINGDRTISFPNGQREVHTQNFKRREYPDGTVKTVYQDGKQETRYSSGRLRVKDQSGNIVLDTGLSSGNF